MCKCYEGGGIVLPHSHRLPTTVVPSRYDLTLRPDLGAATFTGKVVIDIDVRQPVDEIILNAAELLLTSAHVTDDAGTSLTGTVLNGAGQALDGSVAIADLKDDLELGIIRFAGKLGKGKWKLHVDFRGILNDKLHGFYRSTYKGADGVEHVIASTQMEPNDARRAFPCFDEPSFKATFATTLIVDENLTAISNGRIVETVSLSSEQGKKAVRFKETMKMATYLVAFVVGEFERTDVINVHGTEVSIYYPPGKGHMAPFGLKAAAHSLEWYWKYFGINYHSFGDKLDHIAIPDFAFGAMENLGCVTYRETALLCDEATATVGEKIRVAEVIAHETAHMWFGDLVTMKWWNGLWLNEAFATFMSWKCIDAWKPEWKLWDRFAVSRAGAFSTDGLKATRPVEASVDKPAEALGMVDVITYQKGGSLLRMLEQFIGLDVFRDGIRHYLATNKFGNAETTDLWDAIEHVAGRPVRSMMDSWIFQPGHPVVSVELSDVEGCITLTQHNFKYLTHEADSDLLWTVPVKLRAKTASGEVDMFVELDTRSKKVFIGEGIEWLIVNAEGNGFFRTRYSADLAAKLSAQIQSCSVPERYNFVGDLWACVRSGLFTGTDYLNAIAVFSSESDPNVLGTLLGTLGRLSSLLPKGQRGAFEEKVRELANPIFARLGWEPKDGETPQERQLRGTLVSVLGTTGGDEAVRAKAAELFTSYKADRKSVPADLVPALVGIRAYTGGRAEFDEFKAMRAATVNPQEQVRFLYALAGFRDKDLLLELLAACMTDEVRTQDAPFLVGGLIGSDEIGAEAWQFVKDNWADMVARYPETGFIRMVGGITGLSTREQMADVQTWLSANPVRGGDKAVSQALEQLHINVLLDERERPAIMAAFAPAAAVTEVADAGEGDKTEKTA